jgi:GTP-binding protein
VVDTGGLRAGRHEGILFEMAKQATHAIAEADASCSSSMRAAASRRRTRPSPTSAALRAAVLLAVNKAEGMQPARAAAEFHELGLGEPLPISAAHGENVRDLVEQALDRFSVAAARPGRAEAEEGRPATSARSRWSGGPTSASRRSSTRCSARERVIAFDEPGTTRDAIHLAFRARRTAATR